MGVRQGLSAALRRSRRRGRVPADVAGEVGGGAARRSHMARRIRRTRGGRAAPLHRAGRVGAPERPELVGRIGINLVGPTLLAHATPEQRTQWLPKILRADELWCQLFSEPSAGSDLASVTTRAVHDDAAGGWVVNGQKVWTSYAQFADWGLCLARTDAEAPKHKGISALVIDMGARRGGATARAVDGRRRVQRGLLRRRGRSRGSGDRPGQRRLARVVVDAHARARHEPAAARAAHPVVGGAAEARARERRVRRSSPRPTAGAGVRRGPALPVAQLALALASNMVGSSGPRARRSSCTGAR